MAAADYIGKVPAILYCIQTFDPCAIISCSPAVGVVRFAAKPVTVAALSSLNLRRLSQCAHMVPSLRREEGEITALLSPAMAAS
jgi:hypothetical protein